MAIEQIFFGIKQDLMAKASDFSTEGSRLLKEGKREEGELQIEAAKREIDKTKAVDTILPGLLDQLRAAGIDQPSVQFLSQLVSARFEARAKEEQTTGTPTQPTPRPRRETTTPVIPQAVAPPARPTERTITAPTTPERRAEGTRRTTERPRTVRATPDSGARKRPRERKASLEIGDNLQPIARDLFEINSDRSDFAYPALRDVARHVYADTLEAITDLGIRESRENGLVRGLRMQIGMVSNRLASAGNVQLQDLPESMRTLVTWIKSQPEYSNLSLAQLSSIADRKVTFQEIMAGNVPAAEARVRKPDEGQTRRTTERTRTTAVVPERGSRRRRKERKVSLEIGNNVMPVARALFEINPDRTDFANPSPRDIVRQVFAETLASITNPEAKEAKEKGLEGALRMLRGVVSKRLAASENIPVQNLPESMRTFVEWVKSQPEYSRLSVSQLSSVADRKVTFQQVTEGNVPAAETRVAVPTATARTTERGSRQTARQSTPAIPEPAIDLSDEELQFNQQETLGLAQRIFDRSEDIGMNLHVDDRTEVGSIIERVSSAAQGLDSADFAKLSSKLNAFLRSREKVFMANLDNEDAQYLLSLVGRVNSSEQIDRLVK